MLNETNKNMKVIIENTCLLSDNSEENKTIFLELGRLTHWIGFYINFTCDDEKNEFDMIDQAFIKELFEHDINHFAYGFGSGHMWVHQKKDNKILSERIIFVDFTA